MSEPFVGLDIAEVKDITVFAWRDRSGVFHDVRRMTTRHLYYTLLMIWNHSAQEHLKYRPFKEYDFTPFYTKEYFIEAVPFLLRELQTRDLPDQWRNRLIDMSRSVVCMKDPKIKCIQHK